jgi:hypothetical protein
LATQRKADQLSDARWGKLRTCVESCTIGRKRNSSRSMKAKRCCSCSRPSSWSGVLKVLLTGFCWRDATFRGQEIGVRQIGHRFSITLQAKSNHLHVTSYGIESAVLSSAEVNITTLPMLVRDSAAGTLPGLRTREGWRR